jgi:hypothetical protein
MHDKANVEKSRREGESEFPMGACCYKSTMSKIQPSAIFGDRNVCYASARGKADFVASTVLGEIYKKVEISRKTQFNSVAGDKHIHQHADREY